MAADDVDIALSVEEQISAPMVAALESAWSAIRQRHPEVLPVMIVVGAGSVGTPAGTLKLGHFAALRWTASDSGDGAPPIAEVFVGGEGLARGAEGVLGTLLHEAAHALADVRGIKDTSRQGRWHNAKFKALAEELGIEVTKDPRIGWSPTSVTDGTRADYAGTIVALHGALRHHRSAELGTGTGKAKKPTAPPCVCNCGRLIRVAASVLELGPITCGLCDTDFARMREDDK